MEGNLRHADINAGGIQVVACAVSLANGGSAVMVLE